MKLKLFQLHHAGKGAIPEGFEDIYLCDLLGITQTELEKQPADWVEKMKLWHEAKAKAEDVRQKRQAASARRR